jgi:hypothetical protein
MEVFLSIGLTEKDVDMMFTAFWDIDADNSGQKYKQSQTDSLFMI